MSNQAKKKKLPFSDLAAEMIDEEMISEEGASSKDSQERRRAKEDNDKIQVNKVDMVLEEGAQEQQLGHFDEFGEFQYDSTGLNEDDVLGSKKKKKAVIDLKDLSEQNFLDLIASKNQDTRYYSWLHLHPLFDDFSDKEEKARKKQKKNRRCSEQIHPS